MRHKGVSIIQQEIENIRNAMQKDQYMLQAQYAISILEAKQRLLMSRCL